MVAACAHLSRLKAWILVLGVHSACTTLPIKALFAIAHCARAPKQQATLNDCAMHCALCLHLVLGMVHRINWIENTDSLKPNTNFQRHLTASQWKIIEFIVVYFSAIATAAESTRSSHRFMFSNFPRLSILAWVSATIKWQPKLYRNHQRQTRWCSSKNRLTDGVHSLADVCLTLSLFTACSRKRRQASRE